MSRDWEQIQSEYITGNISYRKLSQKYEVSESALTEKAVAEQWFQKRKNYRSKAVAKSLDLSCDHKAEQLAKFDEVTDRLLDRIEAIIDGMDCSMTSVQQCRSLHSSVECLKTLSESLLNIKEVMSIQSDQQLYEQQLRAEALKKRAKSDTNSTAGVLLVEFK